MTGCCKLFIMSSRHSLDSAETESLFIALLTLDREAISAVRYGDMYAGL